MSHISSFAGVLIPKNRLNVLKAVIDTTCPQLELVEGQTSYRSWKSDYGRLAGDWPVPAGMTEETVGENAHHAIRMKPGINASAYEIGLCPGDYDRDADGNIQLVYDLTDDGVPIPESARPRGVHYDANSDNYMLACDFFNEGNGILEAEGVGATEQAGKRGEVTAFGDLYRSYQMALDAQVAKENGDQIEFFNENGVYYSVKHTEARLGV